MKQKEPQIFNNGKFNKYTNIENIEFQSQNSFYENEFQQIKLRHDISHNKNNGKDILYELDLNKSDTQRIQSKTQISNNYDDDQTLNQQHQKEQGEWYYSYQTSQQLLQLKQQQYLQQHIMPYSYISQEQKDNKNSQKQKSIDYQQQNSKFKVQKDEQLIQNNQQINKNNDFKIISPKYIYLDQQCESQIQQQKQKQLLTEKQNSYDYFQNPKYSQDDTKICQNKIFQQKSQKSKSYEEKAYKSKEKKQKTTEKHIQNTKKKQYKQLKISFNNSLNKPSFQLNSLTEKENSHIYDQQVKQNSQPKYVEQKQITLSDIYIEIESDIENEISEQIHEIKNKRILFQDVDLVTFKQNQNVNQHNSIEQLEMQEVENMILYEDLFEFFRFKKLKKGLTSLAFQRIFYLSIQNNYCVIPNDNYETTQEENQTRQDLVSKQVQNNNNQIDGQQNIIDLNNNQQTQYEQRENQIYNSEHGVKQFIFGEESKYSTNFVVVKHDPQVKVKAIGLLNIFNLSEKDPRRMAQNIQLSGKK